MRTNVHRIRRAIRGNLETGGTEVLLKWVVYPAGATPDPVTQTMMVTPEYQSGLQYQNDSVYVGSPTIATPVELEECIKAFLHTPNPARSEVMQFNEIKVGDLIMDFSPELDLDCREGLRVCVDGQEWAAKKISDELAETWDAIQGGLGLYKTILLRRSLGS